jgi:hypothetical protein
MQLHSARGNNSTADLNGVATEGDVESPGEEKKVQ